MIKISSIFAVIFSCQNFKTRRHCCCHLRLNPTRSPTIPTYPPSPIAFYRIVNHGMPTTDYCTYPSLAPSTTFSTILNVEPARYQHNRQGSARAFPSDYALAHSPWSMYRGITISCYHIQCPPQNFCTYTHIYASVYLSMLTKFKK
jgi:hypothetical protein